MSNHRYSKFWWQDWHGEPCLQSCSLAARGLWMELLCLAHGGEPYGHVTVAGDPPTTKAIAHYARTTEREVIALLSELEKHKVFNRTNDGIIYSRRMVKDGNKSDEGTKAATKRWGNKSGNGPPNGSGSGKPKAHLMGNSILNIHRSESESESAREPTSPMGGLGSRWHSEAYERTPETDAVIVALEAKTTRAPTEPKPAPISSEHLAALRARARLA